MKRFIICMSMYTLFLCIPIQASEAPIHYKIYADATDNKTFDVKQDTLALLDYICEGVDVSSHGDLIQEKIAVFKKLKNTKVSYTNDTLHIRIGDGQGTTIQGTYKEENVCFEEVKPKSKLVEIFKGGK